VSLIRAFFCLEQKLLGGGKGRFFWSPLAFFTLCMDPPSEEPNADDDEEEEGEEEGPRNIICGFEGPTQIFEIGPDWQLWKCVLHDQKRFARRTKSFWRAGM
jgi:hypothetical protein